MNRKHLLFLISLGFVGYLINSTTLAADQTAVGFLKIPVGSRPVGMGETFVSLAEDANALGWNPGGLDLGKTGEVNFTHLEWLGDLHYENLNYLQPLGKLGTFGISGVYLPVEGIFRRDEQNQLLGTFAARDILVHFGYGKALGKKLGIGLAGKYIQECLDPQEKPMTGFAGDFGALATFAEGKIRLGVCAQNLGKLKSIVAEYELPIIFRAGLSFFPLQKKIILTVEGDQELNGNLTLGIGTECWLSRWLAFRIGYRYKPAVPLANGVNGLRAGVGFKIASERETGVKIDYAFVPSGDFGFTHRISCGIIFGAEGEEKVAKSSPEKERKILAVVKFKNINISPTEAIFISNLLRTSLKEISPLSKQEQDKLIHQYFPQGMAPLTEPKATTKIGELLEVENIIIGSCKKTPDGYNITIKVVNVSTQKIVYTDTVDSLPPAEIEKGVNTLAKGILKYFATEKHER